MLDLPTTKAEEKFRGLGFSPPKRRKGDPPDFGPIMAFIERRIAGVMEFYTNCRSEAVMCPELRDTINRELAPIVDDACKAFDLEPMDVVLRVRAIPGHPELIKVRAEKRDLC